ncbi:MAG: NfeD family protein [Oscillospiraceae bacterium]|nr:NfeD family protein [Oscillospiraceae bacterium]
MAWFSEWWGGLDLVRQVLYCIAFPGTVLLVLQTVLVIFGIGGGDADMGGTDIGNVSDASDFSDGGSGDYGVAGLFTFQGIVAFFCVFGWSGIIFIEAFGNAALSLVLGFALGFGAMLGVAKIIRLSGKLQHSGNLNMNLLIGESGIVYIPIPEETTSRGKVTVQLAERQIECDAVSESGALPINTPVRVTDILAGNVLVVEKL